MVEVVRRVFLAPEALTFFAEIVPSGLWHKELGTSCGSTVLSQGSLRQRMRGGASRLHTYLCPGLADRSGEFAMPVVQTELLCHVGVGIDTARYGHHVSFLRDDRQLAAPALSITESREGYEQLQRQLHQLHQRHPNAEIHVHVDAAG